MDSTFSSTNVPNLGFSAFLLRTHGMGVLVQVRQSCFVALLEELAAKGVCGSESNRLKALVEARAVAAKSAKAESYLAAPASSLRLGSSGDVASAAAFRSAVARCVSDALFAFGEAAPPLAVLAAEPCDAAAGSSSFTAAPDAARACRAALAFLAAECRARRSLGAASEGSRPPESGGVNPVWSRLDLGGGSGAWANANAASGAPPSAGGFVSRPLAGSPRPPLSARARLGESARRGSANDGASPGPPPVRCANGVTLLHVPRCYSTVELFVRAARAVSPLEHLSAVTLSVR